MKRNKPISAHGKPVGQPKKRWLFAGITLVLFIISLIALFYIAENSAENKLLELVNRELSPNSEMVIDDFSISLLPLGLTIKNITLLNHSTADPLSRVKPTDAIRSLSIEEVSVSGINILSLLRREHIKLKRFNLHGVHLEAFQPDSIFISDSAMMRDPLPITISDIQFSELNLKLFESPLSDSTTTEVQNLNGTIMSLNLSDITKFNDSTFEVIDISADHFNHFTENGYYEASLDSFRLNTITDQVSFSQFHLRPLLNAYEMALDLGYPIDNYDFKIPTFKIDQMDLNSWIEDGELTAGKITLSEPDILISRDKSLPRREREDRDLPHLLFKNLPYSVNIDTILTENGILRYQEEFAVENRAGGITFTEIDISLYSLENRSSEPIYGEATALFMNQSDFDLNVMFSLDDNGSHTVSGNLYQLDLTTMNTTFENLVLIHLDSGVIQQLNFRFDANDDRAFGELLFIYSDLNLRFIDAEQKTERGWNRVRSFIANTFVIRSDNSADDPRSGEIEFDRDKERSIFNFWVSSLSTGLVDTIKR
tara:strand:- start:16477 stop:18096 length:1620 start_codon:yes stop_codon:yes gene_type:complete